MQINKDAVLTLSGAKGRDKKRDRKFLKWFLLCLLLLVTHALWLPLPARFLVVKDNIKKADAVVVLSGDWNFDREKRAVELYKMGFADKIIRVLERKNISFDIIKRLLNLEAAQQEIYMRYFESNGADAKSLILGEAIATSTFDELNAVKDIVLKNRFKSMILVTGDYHMRRALLTARWVFRSKGIAIYNATIYSETFNPNKWWLDERGIKEVIFEYLNSGFYLLYHFMLGK